MSTDEFDVTMTAAFQTPGRRKNNFTATTNPGVSDDIDSEYEVGSVWVDVTADATYRCVDSTAGAAVWHLGVVPEEGTWTPVLTFTTAGDLSVGYSTQAATYRKVGSLVYVAALIATSTFTFTTASGSLLVTGLPFTAGATYWHFGSLYFEAEYNSVAPEWVVAAVQPSTTQAEFRFSRTAGSGTTLQAAHFTTGDAQVIRFSLTYQV